MESTPEAKLSLFLNLKSTYMKNWSLLLIVAFTFIAVSCGETEEPVKKEDPQSLVEVKDGIYTEYYPGRKAVKFRGPQNEQEQRDGRWFFYAENGTELSMTEFSDGKRNGASFVRYPNGQMHYYGEYQNDVQVGIWVTYNAAGEPEERDFGYPETATAN